MMQKNVSVEHDKKIKQEILLAVQLLINTGDSNVKHITLIQMFPNRCLAAVTEYLYRYVTLPRYYNFLWTFHREQGMLVGQQWAQCVLLECISVTFSFRCKNNPALHVTLLSLTTAVRFCDITDLPAIHYFQMRIDESRIGTRPGNGNWYLSCNQEAEYCHSCIVSYSEIILWLC